MIFVTTSTTGWWWWGENALESQLWVRVGDGIIDPFSMVCSASMITNGYLPTIHSMAMAGLNKTNPIQSTTMVKWSKKHLPFQRPKVHHFHCHFHVPASKMARWEGLEGYAMSQHQFWQDENGSRALPWAAGGRWLAWKWGLSYFYFSKASLRCRKLLLLLLLGHLRNNWGLSSYYFSKGSLRWGTE